MRRLALILIATWACGVAPSHAQVTVVSAKAEKLSVTAYRDADRGSGEIDARNPQGYALISETRRIAVPAGDAVIRFEGVADGMIAVSAVVTGLSGKVQQKNRDVRLLSPAALLDGSLGNHVHLKRTERATGRVTEEDVIVRSASANAVVLETVSGFEGLQCSGLPEGLSYNAVPEGLSALPTFSVEVHSDAASTDEVTLTYLATGFDWGANYVARVGADGRTLDLFAWLTVANGNSVGFPDAQLLAIAGRPNVTSDFRSLVTLPEAFALRISCWPLPTYDAPMPPPPPPPPAPMAAMDIVVTAQRRTESLMAAPAAVIAQQEELGDLKLYRMPAHVDINASGQKQVALLERKSVPFRLYYAADIGAYEYNAEGHQPLRRMVRMENRKDAGLGLPLPSGGTALYEMRGDQPLLIAEGNIRDHAEGEAVELEMGESGQQFYTVEKIEQKGRRARWRLTLTNAAPGAVHAEIKLSGADHGRPETGKLQKRDGRPVWMVDVPGNGRAVLEFTAVAEE